MWHKSTVDTENCSIYTTAGWYGLPTAWFVLFKKHQRRGEELCGGSERYVLKSPDTMLPFDVSVVLWNGQNKEMPFNLIEKNEEICKLYTRMKNGFWGISIWEHRK